MQAVIAKSNYNVEMVDAYEPRETQGEGEIDISGVAAASRRHGDDVQCAG